MLLAGICEANKRFEEMQSEFRFTEREDLLDVAERDMLFEIFQAKKKNGMPKEEEPSKWYGEVASVWHSLILMESPTLSLFLTTLHIFALISAFKWGC